MKKVKLTQAQVDDIKKALESNGGNANGLIISHRIMMEDGLKWQNWPSLNEVSPQDLHDALKYDYEVIKEVVKLPREAIKALEYLEYEAGYSINDILRIHKRGHSLWDGEASGLNGIDYETLKTAMHKGFEVEEKMTLEEVLAVVRKENMKQANMSSRKELELELDYQLASLHDAIESRNVEEITKIKKRLSEIHSELGLGGKTA